MNPTAVQQLAKIPEGYSIGMYGNRTYGITKETFAGGRSYKLYAKELGGRDFISCNMYITKEKNLLKPCEMARSKVVDFLERVTLITNSNT